ncbi:hypothetical protein CC1G_02520 [Coprinopsis cinerea okayama7|uniref:Uncharacterized protein n=1 Tax=Coprinopsis cinerea (strain Okayama-7 / 130 / ATCC MYA-4618 / FGSC 9003) TaxID=240176 RepID=A8NBR0_COPC7|nr:hypothetical protein CC1G_02520 [Coprinopsis cinerea okayama7\|eukprot:XP_001832258.1 hypothetical protein CC1G_02520 [Coprinopsis cinerea okayama7\
MENPLTVIVDNASDKLGYNGGQWETEEAPNTFGGSQSVCFTDRPSGPSNVSFSFLGRSVEVYGTVDRSLVMKTVVNKAPYNPLDETAGAPTGRRGVKLFEAGLISGSHEVRLEPESGQLSIDYFIYSPVGKTKFNGEDLIFDDTHTSLNFTGPWTPMKVTDLPELPFNFTLLSTTQAGASFSFAFTGESISVFGGARPNAGRVSAEYTIDGSSPTSVVTTNRRESQDGWTLHQEYFKYEVKEKPDAEHILNVTVLEASEEQPFFLDYVIVRGNEHTEMAERRFKKTGSDLSSAGMKIGLVIMAIVVGILLWVGWTFYRKRRKAKGCE